MKKYILLFVLLISCCIANARTSWTVRGGGGAYNYRPTLNFGVETSVNNQFSRWSLCPSINITLGEAASSGFDSQIMAGYDIPMGYRNQLKLKSGIIVGYFGGGDDDFFEEEYNSSLVLGPSIGIDFKLGKHFIIGLNSYVSGIPIEYYDYAYYYDDFCTDVLWSASLTFGYKF